MAGYSDGNNRRELPLKPSARAGRSPKVATIADVAQLAGVSPMTVSRVINGEQNVRPGTREKVQAAVAELNYVPNQAARHLAGSEPIRIGMLYVDPGAGYLSEFLIGLLNKATLRHVQLVVQRCEAARVGDEKAAAEMIANGIDGLILPPPFCDSQPLFQLVTDTDTPAVVVSSGTPPEGVCAVGIDDYQAAYEMTRHLMSLGHHRLGYIIGDPSQSSSARRLAGFHAAMADAGLNIEQEEVVAQGMFTYRSGLDAAEALLAQERRPTAIFASNDDMAAGVLSVAHDRRIDVPRDLSVAGFDDTTVARMVWPKLTTIHQPMWELAEAATALLVEGGPTQHVRLPHRLVERQSTARPAPIKDLA